MKHTIYLIGLFVVMQMFGCYAQSDSEFHKLQAKFISESGLNVNFRHKADPWLDSLKILSEKNPEKYRLYYNNAIIAREQTDTMYNYLQSVKEAIATRSGGWTDSTKEMVRDDKNLDIPAQYFLKEKHGIMLRDSLKIYQTDMMKHVPDKLKYLVKIRIDISDPPKTKDGGQHSWEEYYWEGVPSIAALTELEKFQYDVQLTEGDVIRANYTSAKNK